MKKILGLLVLMLALIAMSVNVDAQVKLRDQTTYTLIDDDSVVATVNSSYVFADFDYNYTVQVDFDSLAGTCDGTVLWQASNDGVSWVTLTTLSLVGRSSATTYDAFPFTSTTGAAYKLYRVRYVESTAASADLLITLFVRKFID